MSDKIIFALFALNLSAILAAYAWIAKISSGISEKLVSKEVCNIVNTNLKEVLHDVRKDVKKILAKINV